MFLLLFFLSKSHIVPVVRLYRLEKSAALVSCTLYGRAAGQVNCVTVLYFRSDGSRRDCDQVSISIMEKGSAHSSDMSAGWERVSDNSQVHANFVQL